MVEMDMSEIHCFFFVESALFSPELGIFLHAFVASRAGNREGVSE